MGRYYDQPCEGCAECALNQPGQFPDGRLYRACRGYGYILHYDRGVSQESCPKQTRQEDRTPRPKSIREMKRRK